MHYLQLKSGAPLPQTEPASPFRAIVIADIEISPDQRTAVSEWLVAAGCLYLMAWGESARAWQDAVNLANLQAWDFAAIPDDKLVMTTCHAGEELTDVLWFSRYTAMHPCDDLDEVLLLHIANHPRETELVQLYESV